MVISSSSPRSFVDSSFFTELSKLKLDVLKLDASELPIYGSYNYKAVGSHQQPAISLNGTSYASLDEYVGSLPKNSAYISPGKLINVNTLDEFKRTDKKKLLHAMAESIYDKIVSKEVLQDPSLLSQFQVLSFADLKKYKFYYWLAFPMLHVDWQLVSLDPIDSNLYDKLTQESYPQQISLVTPDGLKPLASLESTAPEVLFVDTSTENESPSYVLRNLLAAFSVYEISQATVHVYRLNHPELSFTITCKTDIITKSCPKVSGWERTAQGRLGPKLADLGSLIDPVQLADQATDLNLKLMRWRIAPNLDLDIVRNQKCLLLGSGTLGSYVARALLAWGVRKITFVDNGNVSFSNPVRQSLYTFEDCLDGGHPKAETAAAALKKIFPRVDAQGFSLEVPMAGHPVTNEARQKADYDKLCELFDEHDAVFILMDSRETRWLPTVLGNAKHKIVLNAALGFESFLVMRHGCPLPDLPLDQQAESRLGCYFCNDVYAPSDSLTDRTLDQMCTVTRPGVAMMASSLAVELFVSILQSKDKQYSPHSLESTASALGGLPHQIRGFLHSFELLKLSAKNFRYCSACSTKVIDEYNENGWEFVKKTLADPKYLEDLVGLTQIHEEAEKAALEFDALDSEEEIV